MTVRFPTGGALFLVFAFGSAAGNPPPKTVAVICDAYIQAWMAFYPSRAFSLGDQAYAASFENFSEETIAGWLAVNHETLRQITHQTGDLSLEDRIDLSLLKRRVSLEIEKWERDRAHQHAAGLYAGHISQALTYILVHENMTPSQKIAAIRGRLKGIVELSKTGEQQLRDGAPERTSRALRNLERSARFYGDRLPEIAARWLAGNEGDAFKRQADQTATAIQALAAHVRQIETTLPDAMGFEAYQGKLLLNKGRDLTPQRLEVLALEEIHRTRKLMGEMALTYWRKAYPDQAPPPDEKVLQIALRDMEADREDNQADFLKLFKELTDQAEAFVRDKGLATVPRQRTLVVDLSPEHFSGAAVGGVYVAGPFDPEANTLFYIPSIADSASQEAKDGFYRSFNNPFNTMIIAHEMFPGHYMQFKVANRNPRLVRSLFPDGDYVEGWGTFCEVLALDAGWHGNHPLTRLAHLRKRLENATRAYTSIQVHCRGWNKERLTSFAVETGLLAPQFAVNLWNRIMSSPFQLTTYFLGFREFSRLFEHQRERLGQDFSTRAFSDKILTAGAIPIHMVEELFP